MEPPDTRVHNKVFLCVLSGPSMSKSRCERSYMSMPFWGAVTGAEYVKMYQAGASREVCELAGSYLCGCVCCFVLRLWYALCSGVYIILTLYARIVLTPCLPKH